MNGRQISRPAAFRVIEGGGHPRSNGSVRAGCSEPLQVPRLDAATQACELAQLYALSLLRDVPLKTMTDPNCAVWVDGATRITLHELTSELTALMRACPPATSCRDGSLSQGFSLSVQGTAGHRFSSQSDDQCEISSLFKEGFNLGADALSVFLEADIWGGRPVPDDVAVPVPHAAAPMSHWVAWAQMAIGAGAVAQGAAGPVQSLHDLAVRTQRRDARHEGFAAALLLLSQGAPFDSGLVGTGPLLGASPWTGTRLLSLMAEGARRAHRATRSVDDAAVRLARPAVTAARVALLHECEDLGMGPDRDILLAALALLRTHAPGLLEWIGRLNAVSKTGQFALPNPDGSQTEGWSPIRFRQNLMLPPLRQDGRTLCARPGRDRVVTAGTLVTLLKAVFAQPGPGNDRDALGGELDKLVANIALGRCVVGAVYPYENKKEIMQGQLIALNLLRERLRADGRDARLHLTDFEGRALCLRAYRDGPGQTRVTTSVNGVVQVAMPCGQTVPSTLTEVV